MTTRSNGSIRTRAFSPASRTVRTFGYIRQNKQQADEQIVHSTTRRRSSAPFVMTMTQEFSSFNAA